MNDNMNNIPCPCDTCPNADLCDLSEFGPYACIHWVVWNDQMERMGK